MNHVSYMVAYLSVVSSKFPGRQAYERLRNSWATRTVHEKDWLAQCDTVPGTH